MLCWGIIMVMYNFCDLYFGCRTLITIVGPTRCRYWLLPTHGWVDFTFWQNGGLISFKLCVGCWGHLRLDYSLVSPIIYHGKPSLSRYILFFLTNIRSWYKRSEFGLRIAIFFSAATLSGAFGGLLAACGSLIRIDERLTIFEGCNLAHGRCGWKSGLVLDLQFVTPFPARSLLN